MYPRVVEGVGIAMKTLANSILKPVVGQVRGAMEDAVLEAYCDSASPDVEHVKARMREAKNKSIEKLLGIKNYVGTR
jgi:hypothetical protein